MRALRRVVLAAVGVTLAAAAAATPATAAEPGPVNSADDAVAGQSVAKDDRGRTIVYVEGAQEERLRAAVAGTGGDVAAAVPGRVKAAVPAGELDELAASPGVTEVRLPDRAVPMAITSEGVAATKANLWHQDGKRGAGVKVGIVDVGFGLLEDAQAAGELPANVQVNDSGCLDGTTSSSHGTAIAEIVHDVAPDAQLFLACVEDTVSFATAATWLREQDVDVVTAAIGFLSPAGGRGDGSGPAGSPADVVRASREAGILWSVAAGNLALAHYAGRPTDADGDGWIDYRNGVENNGFTVDARARATVGLRWDAWPRTKEDLDLYVMSAPHAPTGPTDPDIVARSTRSQGGSADGLSPTEELEFANGGDPAVAKRFYIYVKNSGARPTTGFELFVNGAVGQITYHTPAGSVTEPATSPHVMTVGATPVGSGQPAEYSGQGPTTDGRQKPDLLGPTGVSTSTFPVPLTGTSAAAAHAAGAAALLKSANPQLDPAQVQAALRATASPKKADNQWGHGGLSVGAPGSAPTFAGAGFTVNQSQERVFSQGLGPGAESFHTFGSVPGDTTAVAVILSARADVDTAIDVHPGGVGATTGRATTLHVRGGQEFTSLTAFVPLGPDRTIRLRNRTGNAWLVIEELGHFSPSSGTDLFTAAAEPKRVLDTRGYQNSPRDTPLKNGDTQEVQVRGVAGVPADATAVVVNLTGFEATGQTYLSLHGGSATGITFVSVGQADRRSNLGVVPIAEDGRIRVKAYSTGAQAGAALDVVGWFAPGSGSKYVTLPEAARIADTATGNGLPVGPIGHGRSAPVQVKGVGAVSSNAVAAALTVTGADDLVGTELTVSPAERGWSPVTNTGSRKLETMAGLVLSPLGQSGRVTVRNERGEARVSVDVAGYFVGGQPYTPPASNCVTAVDEPGFTSVFDGRVESDLGGWRTTGAKSAHPDGCELLTQDGLDATWYAARTFNNDYTLKLDWKATAANADSGVHLLFPAPVTETGGRPIGQANQGVEVNIGPTTATATLQTGGFVGRQAPSTTAPVKPVGEWNTFELVVRWDSVTVLLNGTQVNHIALPPGAFARNSYFGLQNSGANDRVRFRNIRVKRDTPAVSGQFRAAGLCLDLANGDPAQSVVWMYGCHNGFSEVVSTTSDGGILLAGRCLATENFGTANGTTVVLQACQGNDSEQWIVRRDGRIVNVLSGRCLTPTGSTNTARLQVRDCAGSRSEQVWQLPATRGRSGNVAGPGGNCLDVVGNDPRANQAHLYTCNSSPAQSWVVPGDGTVRGAGKCLDVSDAGTAAGTPVKLWECNGHAAQQWLARPDGTLVNPVSNRCLTSSGTHSGATLTIEDCTLPDRQRWRLTAETVTRGAIVGHVDKCLDVVGNDPNNNGLWLWTCYGPGGQLWWDTGDGAFRAFGKCLDIGSVNVHTPVGLHTCNGATSQQWVARYDGTIVNALANLCLDARDAESYNGATVQTEQCSGHVAQRWTIPVRAS